MAKASVSSCMFSLIEQVDLKPGEIKYIDIPESFIKRETNKENMPANILKVKPESNRMYNTKIKAVCLGLELEGRQMEEALLAIFHTLLFHRSTGKFQYQSDGSYTVGTQGFEDVDCDFIDFNYVRNASRGLHEALKRDVESFCQVMKAPDTPSQGQIYLEFYSKKPGMWPFASEAILWEVWAVRVHLKTLSNEHERQMWREKVGDALRAHMLCITDTVNRNDYIPSPPTKSELDMVYDTSFPEVQPFLFKVRHSVSAPSNPSVSSTVRKLLSLA